MRKYLLASLFIIALASTAIAQTSVKQSGFVTPGHVTQWTTNGVVQDAGTAVNGSLSGVGVRASGQGICQNSGPNTGAYNQICLDVGATAASIDFNNFGGATGGLSFKINGIAYPFPFPTGGILGPATTVSGNGVCWNNTIGTLVKGCSSLILLGSSTGVTTLANANSGASNFTVTIPAETGTLFTTADTITVPNGGTGAATFSSNQPLIGNGTSAIAQGTRSGNTTIFANAASASPAAGCAQWDGNSNLTSVGANCGVAGATAPGGSDKQVQYNSSNAFAGSSNLTYTSGGSILTNNGPVISNLTGGTIPSAIIQAPSFRGFNSANGTGGAELYTYGGASLITLANAGGNIGAPTATTSTIFRIIGYGYDTTQFGNGPEILGGATQTWTTAHYGSQILIYTVPNNTTTRTLALTIDQDQSLTVAGAGTVNGQFNAQASTNNITLVTGTGSSNRTTLVSDNARHLLASDGSHNLVSDQTFYIYTNGLGGCVSLCSSFTDLNTAVGALAVAGPGFALGGGQPVFSIISINSNQVNDSPQINFAAAGGTLGTPVATASAALMMQINFEGYNGGNWELGGSIDTFSLDSWTGAHNGAQLQFFANAAGTTYSQNSLTLTLDAGNGVVAYYPVVLHGASAATANAGDVALGNTTAASANCGSLAGGAACLKFYIGSNAHYIPYY